MSRTVARAGTDTVTVEAFSSVDGQGAPSYDAGTDIEIPVRLDDELVEDVDGSMVRVTLRGWVPSDVTPVPEERDRLTVSGSTYIVLTKKPVKRIGGTLKHTRITARDE